MKKFLSIATAVLSVAACTSGHDGWTLKGDIEGGAGKPHASSYPSIEEQLLFDDERCFSYNSDELARACSGLKVKLVYAASLLLMLGGLALATLL